MQDNTRRMMCEAIDAFATTLAWGYTDSAHDEFDLICDKLRWAYSCEEAEMNGETPPSFYEWNVDVYGKDHADATAAGSVGE